MMGDKNNKIQIEKEFHNTHTYGYQKRKESIFYLQELLDTLSNHVFSLLGNLENKKVLNYGCGEGYTTCRKIAEKGGCVIGVDISIERIKRVYNNALQDKLADKIKVIQMDAEKMGFKDGVFDVIFGQAILHHLDIEKCSIEIAQILKENGKAVFIEPLGMNPLINLYRILTPNSRTPYERPLNFKDIRKIGKFFKKFEHKEFCLFSLLSILGHITFKRYNPFKFKWLQKFDEFIFGLFPFLRRYSWITVIIYQK